MSIPAETVPRGESGRIRSEDAPDEGKLAGDGSAGAAKLFGVVERARDAVAELLSAAGQDCDSALAGVPVSGRKIEQRLRQAVVGEPPKLLTIR